MSVSAEQREEARERSRRRHRREAKERARRREGALSPEELEARWRRAMPPAKTPEEREARRMFCSKKERAKRRGLEFTLPAEWFVERLKHAACEESGIPFHFLDTEGQTSAFAPSVDRIDASEGYTPENCRMVLWALNSAFGEWGAEITEEIMALFLEKRGWDVARPERKKVGGVA